MRVEIRELRKRFGDVEALRGVSCEAPSGRRVALVGPNGSGKSTLNRCLMGLLRFEGSVRIDGISPDAERLDVARRIAYVPQTPPNLGAPVGELVAALAQIRGGDPAAVAKLAARLDLPLEAVAARPFRGLSGGMKQKLLISLALAFEPKLVILDEPTGSLDAVSRARFLGLFAELARDATVLLCSHRLEEVRQLVEHVWVLSEGRLTYEGPVEAFLEASAAGLVEVCTDDAEAAAWLRDHGFRPASGGAWVRQVGRREKRELLAELLARFGPRLRDVSARDLESLELPAILGDLDG